MDIPEAIKDLRELEISRKRRVWKPFMKKYDCQIIAEIGVRTGENFKLMIGHNPKVAVAVDIWKNDGVVSRNDSAYNQDILDGQYEDIKRLMVEKPFIQVRREYSFDAVKHFPDEYFDLVYIDADHTYEACLKDIEDWYKKVKKGKFLTGDDFRDAKAPVTGVRFGVKEAVNKFAKDNGLRFYELPRYGWAIIKQG